jgi:hypothetical protein
MNLVMSKTRVYNEDGQALPWLNKHVLDKLISLQKKKWRVFEYGSGHSTLWWQDQVKEIISVEHNKNFYRIIRNDVKNNCIYIRRDLVKRKNCDYVQSINEFDDKFSCVIVDGRNRVLCIKEAIDKVKWNGYLILDNSDRERYKEGVDLLNKRFKIYLKSPVDTSQGITPYIWETTIWKNCL